jgi:transcriptional regulator with XRE-family HTH domain
MSWWPRAAPTRRCGSHGKLEIVAELERVHGSELERALEGGPFSRALRAAIEARGVSLDRLHRKLGQRGVQISPSTLSHWQRGKSMPTHEESMAAVKLLEEVLLLPDGSLIALLRSRATLVDKTLWTFVDRLNAVLDELDMSGADRLVRLSVHDHYVVDAARLERSSWTRSVFRAAEDGVDRLVVVFRAGDDGGPVPTFTDARFCQVGRIRQDRESGYLAVELLFDRPLAMGETTVLEFRTEYQDEAPLARNFDRRFGHPVGQYVLQISFDPAALPVRCSSYSRDAVGAPDRDRRELPIGASASVHLFAGNVTHGICGIDIEWDETAGSAG